MPQIAPFFVVITNEGADERIETHLEPLGHKDGLTSFVGGDTTINETTEDTVKELPTAPALQSLLTVSLARPSKTSRISKTRVKYVEPIEAQDSLGNPTGLKSHENSVDVTFMFSEKATLQERITFMMRFDALMSGNTASPVREVITDQKSFY